MTEENQTIETKPWLESVSEDLRGQEPLTKFKDIDGLARSYVELEKNYNKRLAVPNEKATPEEWQKFYEKLGRPQDKRYFETRSKDDEEYLTGYEETFYNHGLSKKQGEAILKKMYENAGQFNKREQEEIEKIKLANDEFLTKQYGEKREENMALINVVLKKYGSRELGELLQNTYNNPALVDFLVKVGGTLKSDSLITGETGNFNISEPEAAKREIKKLELDDKYMIQYKDCRHPAHEDAVKRMRELYEIAYKKQS